MVSVDNLKQITQILCLAVMLSGCGNNPKPAAVKRLGQANAAPQRAMPSALTKWHSVSRTQTRQTPPRVRRQGVGLTRWHTVKPGDTVFGLVKRYRVDFKSMVRLNKLPSPYVLKVGQKLKIPDKNKRWLGDQDRTRPTLSLQTPATTAALSWQWPTRERKRLQPIYAPGGKKKVKGLDIFGKRGQKIVAAAQGEVVYSGNALRGYGNLVIIKHPSHYISAYAHNQKLLVQEGDTITKGQPIAVMGQSEADQVKLHFEVRHHGKPIDPVKLLPKS